MKYKYVSENHLEKMEDIIINNALPLVIRGKSRNEIERDIISLITKGLLKLRNSGQVYRNRGRFSVPICPL
jgi:hypothetical protein